MNIASNNPRARFCCKRTLDIALALSCLLLFLPLFVAIACWIAVVSPGSVIFRQERVGFLGKRFTMFKFRSMGLNVETQSHEEHVKRMVESGKPISKLDSVGDPRIIPGGRFIRMSCLDELPQLLNVIRGDMSLVGPRPCVPSEFELFSTAQKERFNAKPGLTGYWQVNGKNKTTFNTMVAMDIHYAKSRSLWFDLNIMFKTIPAIWEQIKDSRTSVQPKSVKEESFQGITMP